MKKIQSAVRGKFGAGDGGDTSKVGCSFISFDSHFALLRLTGLQGAGRSRT